MQGMPLAVTQAVGSQSVGRSVGGSGAMPGLYRLLLVLLPPLCMAGSSSSPPAAGCLLKTITVSTLPALRERELSSHHPGDSRLPLHIHSEAPGSVTVRDDLHNTEPPYITLGERGKGEELLSG